MGVSFMDLSVNRRAAVVSAFILLAGLVFGLSLDANAHIPRPWNRVSSIVGWIYFFCWSVSFYPQVFLNRQRRSVVGLSLDYTVLNMLGFSCYSVFNVAFYYSESVQQQYMRRHGGHRNAVELNDVFFSLHAAVLVAVSLFQEDSVLNTLNLLYLLSYVKLMTTLVKCLPQIALNYQRKSTVGWTIWNVLLDIAGGLLSIGQQVLDAAATDDWTAMTGDPVKFSLGFVSIIVDVVFILQHYVFYAENNHFMLHGGEAQPFLPK
ncbi:Lysosomal Cystine Transporter (LCT) Family [Phytophthora cinnamomi]|uniref:Lysosomal Cystine Transporter (LCT) Family n=1 Tax=Phytophthora cinnamomi TaxID=4785 RepID=UPI00355A96C0|nr:Lysosomal Cystine Transporter (LCT) Family [Phytophthora cinnamomi]